MDTFDAGDYFFTIGEGFGLLIWGMLGNRKENPCDQQ
jgi:hypothetical protein